MDDHVEVNGARLVYRCAGEGPISVVVEQQLAGDASGIQPQASNFMGWGVVAEGVSDIARVCVYNRRGVGGSDPRSTAALRTTQDQVDDLVGLIDALGLDTPVVMVGASIAGFNLRLFADQHPDLLAGAVFVDASHPDQSRLLGNDWPAQPVEFLDISISEIQVADKGNMGDKPLVVLTGAAQPGSEVERAIWLDLQSDHATLSTNSRHEILKDASHGVVGTRPDAIVDAIQWIIDQLN